MSTIERMNRFGRREWRVVLDCGHTLTRTTDEIRLQQLYIDKRIGCPECARALEQARGEKQA